MDLWDIFASSNTPLTVAGDAPTDMCQVCNVAFEYIEGGKICPVCNQVEDFSYIDMSNAVQSAVIIRDGHLQTRTQTYNRSKILFESYQRFFVNSKLRPSSDLLHNAVALIDAAQKFTSHNRGQNLNDMMAGAVSIAAGMMTHVINETQLSRIFKTRAGISQGRNKIFTSLAKGQLLGLDEEGLTKDIRFIETDKSISNLIRKSMREVDLNPDHRPLYMFIKSLVMIEKLYQYVDQQIMNTKISASIYYYFTYARDIAKPLTIKEVAERLDISPESIRKYFAKLHYAGLAIRHISAVLAVPIDVPSDNKK